MTDVSRKRAGNTELEHILQLFHDAHADGHALGRGLIPATRKNKKIGSSPLTRGALHLRLVLNPGCGLIPAHAGSTMKGGPRMVNRWAHPSSRGEHGTFTGENGTATGSSPLTQGASLSKLEYPSISRLIPAHAGSTTRG